MKPSLVCFFISLILFMGTSFAEARITQAKVYAASASKLAKYAENRDDDVRVWVAECEHAPSEVLAELANDHERDVVAAVAANPSAPPHILARFAGIDDSRISGNALRNKSLPYEAMAKAVQSSDRSSHGELLYNPSLPIDLLIRLTVSNTSHWKGRNAYNELERKLVQMPANELPKTYKTGSFTGVVILSEPGSIVNYSELKRGLLVSPAEPGHHETIAKREGCDTINIPIDLEAGTTFVHRINFEPTEKVRTLAFENSFSMELVWCPPGTFTMGLTDTYYKPANDQEGRAAPEHEVAITQGFWISRTEVTQAQFEALTGKNPSTFKGPNLPVHNVSLFETRDFCKVVNALFQTKSSLPTEAQWEYACRAGTDAVFPFQGEEPRFDPNWGKKRTDEWLEDRGKWRARMYSDFTEHAVTGPEWGNSEYDAPQPVGSKKPNAWGIYDMCGNVREWCSSFYMHGYGSDELEVNPQGPTREYAAQNGGGDNVTRGGSWGNNYRYALPGHRSYSNASTKSDYIGFRIVIY